MSLWVNVGRILESHGEGLRVIGLAPRAPMNEARAALAESGLDALAPDLYDARSLCGCVLQLA